MVLSHLNFGILAWGYKWEKVIKIQKKVIRIISISKYNADTEPIFKEQNRLKINDFIKLNELKFYFKYKNNRLPYHLQNLLLQPNNDTHNHETRIHQNIHQTKPNHGYAKLCNCV